MKNCIFIAGLFAACPISALAQGVPLYIETDGQLDFSGDYLGDTEISVLLGGDRAVDTFGTPNFIAKDVRSGTVVPVWASMRDYEIIQGGDGILENRHDDLIFDESDADGIVEGLEAAENDADDSVEDMTFTEADGLSAPDIFTGTQPDFLQPAHGVWSIALTRSDASGCPPGISELATAQLEKAGAKEIIFSEPGWVPADLNSDYGRYSWTPVGTNGFQSEPYTTGPQAAGSGVSLVVTMALSAKSETQIDVRAQIQMNLAPAFAAMVGGSTTCLATVTGSYTKT